MSRNIVAGSLCSSGRPMRADRPPERGEHGEGFSNPLINKRTHKRDRRCPTSRPPRRFRLRGRLQVARTTYACAPPAA
jgi:hypothetical protein